MVFLYITFQQIIATKPINLLVVSLLTPKLIRLHVLVYLTFVHDYSILQVVAICAELTKTVLDSLNDIQ